MSSNPPSEDGTASAARTNAKASTGARSQSRYLQPTASTSQKANPFAPTRNTTARKPSPAPTKPEPSFARPTSASVARAPTPSSSKPPPAPSNSSSHRSAPRTQNNAPSEKPTRPARTGSATGMGAPAMRPDPKKKPLSKSVSVAATARARDREHTAPAPMARSTSQSWSTKPPLPPLPPRARGPASPDSLQVAAQFNAWVYLQGTLHSTFVSAQAAAKVVLDTLSRELDAEELCVRDLRVRSEAEGVFSLLHDLTENDASGRVASLLRDYVVQQKAWNDSESAALQLVDRASTRNPISPQECECCLDRISLAVSHAGSTLSRWEEYATKSSPALTALTPLRQVLKERISTMEMARVLVSSVSENIRTLARIEQLSSPLVLSAA